MRTIDSILAVAGQYETIVFDQWGVLHNGKAPYPEAVTTVQKLQAMDVQLCVLSNSGKRADINRQRITDIGFAPQAFDIVMTSGEALAHDTREPTAVGHRSLFPITAGPLDAKTWAKGLPVELTDDLKSADAVLLMGLPDAEDHPTEKAFLDRALQMGLTLICSNPDRASPRAGGRLVQSPGALAHAYLEAGGDVVFYGKPHPAIFKALSDQIKATQPSHVLMVGDSPEHDIVGANSAGWDSLFVAGGLHSGNADLRFDQDAIPTYIIPTLR